MALPDVIYCGEMDFRATLFAHYLGRLGIQVRTVASPEELSEVQSSARPVVRVIASNRDAGELAALVAWVRRHTHDRYPILILAREAYSVPAPDVEVIAPPNYLRTLVRRVLTLDLGRTR